MTELRRNEGTDEDDILTVEEVAAWLRVTPGWVRDHANGKRRPCLPGFKAGKYVRFRRGDVRQAIRRWTQHNHS